MKATRQAYGETLAELGAENENIVVLDADLSKSTMTALFQEKFPERHINCGIAEANEMSVAAGLAASGKTVFASTFAMFAAGRAYEQIRNSIAYPHLNVKICATHAGISVGEDGATHQCIEDLALMRAIPGMVVLQPADEEETRQAIHWAASYNGPVYIRLGRLPVPSIMGKPVIASEDLSERGNPEGNNSHAKLESATNDVDCHDSLRSSRNDGIFDSFAATPLLRNGDDIAIIATGLMTHKALNAAETLQKEHGISARVINICSIKPIDKNIIIAAAQETKGIVTAEEHNVIGGLGSAVAEVLAQHSPAPMRMVGVQDKFGRSGKPADLLDLYGLNEETIIAAAQSLVAEA